MKFCSECGQELKEGAEICPKCGFTINNNVNHYNSQNAKPQNVLRIIIKVLLALACVRTVFVIGYSAVMAWWVSDFNVSIEAILKLLGIHELFVLFNYLNLNYVTIFITSAVFHAVALLWMIPMTIYYFKATADKKTVGFVYKIFVLFLVSPIVGILMFVCDAIKNNQEKRA